MTTFIEAEIGNRIKAIRKQKALTLDQVAGLTGLSKSYLSRVEKAPKAPPVSTIGNIARALKVTISTLLGETNQRTSLCLVRKGDRPLIARDGSAFGYAFEAVAYAFPNKLMEPFVITLPLGRTRKSLFQHEGEEILFVLQGTMKFLHGTEEYIVHEGDCVYFDSGIPHRGESIGDEEVKCFMVFCNITGIRERSINGASRD